MKTAAKIVFEKNMHNIRTSYKKYRWYKLDREELAQELLIRAGFLAILTWLLW